MPVKTSHPFKGLIFALLSLVLTSVTVVLGAAPLHLWLKSVGRNRFIMEFGVLLAGTVFAGWYPVAIMLAILALLVIVFNEFDSMGYALRTSSLVSLVVTSVAIFTGLKFWLAQTDQTFTALVMPLVQQVIGQMQSVDSAIKFLPEDIIRQIPSGIVIGLIAALGIFLLFESRFSALLGIEPRPERKVEFLNFRAPDSFIWLVLLSLLAAFLKGEIPESVRAVGANVINVLIVVYFVQGLALATQFFETYRVSPFWRAIWYFVLTMQLFVFVSCLGLVDYWVDFRRRLQKKVTPTET